MELVDAVIRFSAAGLVLNLALLTLLAKPRVLIDWLLIALSLSIGAILVNSSSFEISDQFRVFLKIFEAPNAVLLWLFGLAFFQDEFRIRPVHWLLLVVGALIGLSTRFHFLDHMPPSPDQRMVIAYTFSFSLMGHLLWRVLYDASDDLIGARRSARLWTVVAFVAVCIAIAFAEIFLPHAVQSFARATAVLFFVVIAYVWLTPFKSERLTFAPAKTPPLNSVRSEDDAINKALADGLKNAIDVDRAYLEQGLTVSMLADRVGAPEHRLRAYINQKTGFRNFAAFINHHRLEAAKTALRDRSLLRTPILTIALDAGFASLPTFNRVFKAAEGITPTEYRRSHLEAAEPEDRELVGRRHALHHKARTESFGGD